MTYYLIETQTIHRIYYAVKTDLPLTKTQMLEGIQTDLIPEMTQVYVGEQITGVETIKDEERFKKECKKLGVTFPNVLTLENEVEALPESQYLEELPE